MLTLPPSTVLLAIDMQQAFDDPAFPPRCNPDCDRNGLALLAAWRDRGMPIIHVRHDSVEPGSKLRPDAPGNAFRPGFGPQGGEALVTKSVNASFIGTDLDLRLRRLGATHVVVFGITTDQCVSTTVRVGANMGWRMVVASDACACFDMPGLDGATIPAETVQAVHLATLAAEFADVRSTAEIVAALP
ncbi:cysteine hydrolase family protein [Alsobacter sp. KACC 23698]|uniref:Cysteine hydrolase family protein n=1 Tax=Alsobacter sp. KACC 23698 TaxID=3149229 RepID=A0AAU7JCW9_9HYPH